MNAQVLPQLLSFFTVFHRLGHAGYRLGDVVFNQLGHLFSRRMSQNHHRHCNPVGAKLHSLIKTAYCQIVSAQLLQNSGHLNRPVPISISFHNPQEFHIASNPLPELGIIMFKGIKINLCPCSSKC